MGKNYTKNSSRWVLLKSEQIQIQTSIDPELTGISLIPDKLFKTQQKKF